MRRFLLVGQTGVGKSSFVNATFGLKKANVDAFEACTKVVEDYIDQTPYGNVCLIDTPGMSEDTLDKDVRYLHLVQSALALKPADITLYITRIDETRFRADEMRTLQVLTTHLNSSIWRNAWIVLTFAASIPTEQLDMVVARRIEPIISFLSQIVKDSESFSGFQRVLCIDNVVPNWHRDGIPVASLLTFN